MRLDQAQGKGKSAMSAKENSTPSAASAQVVADMQSLEYEANMREAAAKGYGKLYAVFGGGQEGLHACAAGVPLLLNSTILLKNPPLNLLPSQAW